MRSEPQASPYRPDPAILPLAGWLGDPVEPASFPDHTLRWRNDRWAAAVGLADLTDTEWIAHFGQFVPLADNLPGPLALRYHGHQFRVYNPDLGDGRGFLFAQMRDAQGRLLDLGTKGSGQTPWSRAGDGRLTLKGAVREIMATELLEALGVPTSKTFSVIETGESLWRGDEPSPTRSAVLVRLGHGHIRFGSFQRLMVLEEPEHAAQLIEYCLAAFPGPPLPADAPGRDEPAVRLLHQVVERMADLSAAWMVAGFVHGVLNTDNMAISGESFDYGPWRWLPKWDPSFTAAYFDHSGLYAFGRQPDAVRWNCVQLAIALRAHAGTEALVFAIDRFGPLYEAAMRRRFCWRLGIEPKGPGADAALIQAAEQAMTASGEAPDIFFLRHRGGRTSGTDDFDTLLGGYTPTCAADDRFGAAAPGLLIEEVERIWSAIAEHDDWGELHRRIAEIRDLGRYLGTPPEPVHWAYERGGSAAHAAG